MDTTILFALSGLVALGVAAYLVLGGSSKAAAVAAKSNVALKAAEYQPFKLISKESISSNTIIFRFSLPSPTQRVGLPVGKHMLLRCTDAEGKPVSRPYTPISSDDDLGHFELLIKLYPNGKMSQHLQQLQIGQSIDVRGPQGSLEYIGNGVFQIMRRTSEGAQMKTYNVKNVGMIAGGSGITPMFQLLKDASKKPQDQTRMSLIFANQTEADILLRKELDGLTERRSLTQVCYTLDRPAEGWTGGAGFVTPAMISAQLPAPGPDTLMLLCGPKPMVDMMEKHLLALGCQEDMIFKF